MVLGWRFWSGYGLCGWWFWCGDGFGGGIMIIILVFMFNVCLDNVVVVVIDVSGEKVNILKVEFVV